MCEPITASVVLAEGMAGTTAAMAGGFGAGLSALEVVAPLASSSVASVVVGESIASAGMFEGMTGMQMLEMGGKVGSMFMQAKGQQDQAQYESDVARNNALTAQYAAEDARRRGDQEASRVTRNAASLAGSQRASFAARGLDVSDGTPGDLVDQTNFFGKVDADTARYNGKVEAWQKTTQAQNYKAQANASAANGSSAMVGSLLSGASAVSEKWNTYSKKAA